MERRVDIVVSVKVPADWNVDQITEELRPDLERMLELVNQKVTALAATWEAEQRDGLPELIEAMQDAGLEL
jgi:hypothetical protein